MRASRRRLRAPSAETGTAEDETATSVPPTTSTSVIRSGTSLPVPDQAGCHLGGLLALAQARLPDPACRLGSRSPGTITGSQHASRRSPRRTRKRSWSRPGTTRVHDSSICRCCCSSAASRRFRPRPSRRSTTGALLSTQAAATSPARAATRPNGRRPRQLHMCRERGANRVIGCIPTSASRIP